MSKFFQRVEKVSEAFFELQTFCTENEKGFVKCDELARVLAKFRANLSGAIMDDDMIPFESDGTVPLPRLASQDMLDGLTVLYPDEERALRVQKTGIEWQAEYPEIPVPWPSANGAWLSEESWSHDLITQVEYFERRDVATATPTAS